MTSHQLSLEAETSIDKAALRSLVVRTIAMNGRHGATSDEVEQYLDMSHQTVSARFTEARRLGLIVESGERRETRSGRRAAVHVVVR